MRKLNLIVVFNKDLNKALFCIRAKEPYKGLYNFVGGKVEENETNEEAAYRELFEETGYLVRELIPLGAFHPSFGSTNEKIHLFQAICSEQRERQLDESEVINIEEIPCEQFKELIFSGEFMHGAGIAAWARHPGE